MRKIFLLNVFGGKYLRGSVIYDNSYSGHLLKVDLGYPK